MTMRRAGAMLVAVSLAVTLAGCGFLKRPDNTFYSLEPRPLGTQGSAPPAPAAGLPIGIDGIELPPGLDRRGIVVRGANQVVEVRGTHQWTAPLEEMVIHTLAFDLANRMPDGMVILPGQAKPSPMRSLYLTFAELAPGPEPTFVLDVRWTLTQQGAPERSGREMITIPMPSMDSPAIVTAMSDALGALADRLVTQL
jgi:uncharacterized protein